MGEAAKKEGEGEGGIKINPKPVANEKLDPAEVAITGDTASSSAASALAAASSCRPCLCSHPRLRLRPCPQHRARRIARTHRIP